jgi:hypothetical protein
MLQMQLHIPFEQFYTKRQRVGISVRAVLPWLGAAARIPAP